MGHIFLSHSTDDDAIARDLQQALGDQGLSVWIDSREMRGGDLLSPEIERAIEGADGCLLLVSTSSLQSDWVSEELDHAIEVQKQRRATSTNGGAYPIVPLCLDGTKLGVFKRFFGNAPVYIPVSSAAGGIEAALDPILVALGRRAPADVVPEPQPRAEPLEELVLELSDLKLEHIEVARHDAGGAPTPAPSAQPTSDAKDLGQAAVDGQRSPHSPVSS
jgi:hypothetical protein